MTKKEDIYFWTFKKVENHTTSDGKSGENSRNRRYFAPGSQKDTESGKCDIVVITHFFLRSTKSLRIVKSSN